MRAAERCERAKNSERFALSAPAGEKCDGFVLDVVVLELIDARPVVDREAQDGDAGERYRPGGRNRAARDISCDGSVTRFQLDLGAGLIRLEDQVFGGLEVAIVTG